MSKLEAVSHNIASFIYREKIIFQFDSSRYWRIIWHGRKLL